MYKVIKYFTDLQDNHYAYQVGDIFPHEGKQVSDKRLAELASADNRRGIPLIAKVEEDEAEAEAETEAIKEEAEEAEKPKKPKKAESKPVAKKASNEKTTTTNRGKKKNA